MDESIVKRKHREVYGLSPPFLSEENREAINKLVSHKPWIGRGATIHLQKPGSSLTYCKRSIINHILINFQSYSINRICKVCLRAELPDDFKSEINEANIQKGKRAPTLQYVFGSKELTKIIVFMNTSKLHYTDMFEILGATGTIAYYLRTLKHLGLVDHDERALYSLTPKGLLIRGLMLLIKRVDDLTLTELEKYETQLEEILLIGNPNKYLTEIITKTVHEVLKTK